MHLFHILHLATADELQVLRFGNILLWSRNYYQNRYNPNSKKPCCLAQNSAGFWISFGETRILSNSSVILSQKRFQRAQRPSRKKNVSERAARRCKERQNMSSNEAGKESLPWKEQQKYDNVPNIRASAGKSIHTDVVLCIYYVR